MKNNKIVYLYSKIMPYQMPVLKRYVEHYGMEVHIIYWDIKGNAPYIPEAIEGVYFYKRSEYNIEKIKSLLSQIAPSLIFISGWQDRAYMKVVFPYKKMGVPVVSGFDDIWYGNIRQRIGSLIFPFYLKRYYSHAWVSGPRQYEFAKKIGFRDFEIIYNLYSGDTKKFSKCLDDLNNKVNDYPKNFLFVGRYVEAKAIDILVKGFQLYRIKYSGDWNLICVGTGPLKHLLVNKSGIKVYDFLSQDEMISLLKNVGVFILPSRVDVSPLVVHEFAAAGLPLILSDSIGNRLTFLIENYNGFLFKKNSIEDLASKLSTITKLSPEKLISMGFNSNKLSRIHDDEFVAASFMSLLKE